MYIIKVIEKRPEYKTRFIEGLSLNKVCRHNTTFYPIKFPDLDYLY